MPTGELIRGVERAAAEHGLGVEKLDGAALRGVFPQFAFDGDFVGLVEREAGVLAVEDCVKAFAGEAVRLGAVLHETERATAWRADGAGVAVTTERGTYRAAKLVVTAGPWAGEWLRSSHRLTLMRQVMLWFAPHEPAEFRRDRFPVFIAETPAGHFYGMPMFGPDGVKVARHYGAPEVAEIAGIGRDVTADDEGPLWDFVRKHVPKIAGRLRHAKTCIYTLTPDRHFVIDVHPEFPQVAVAAGFSGHGFKFAAVVGEVLADLATNGRTELPVALFRLGRFATAAAGS